MTGPRWFRNLLSLALLACLGQTAVCQVADDPAANPPAPAKPGFVVGVWFQPAGSFALWKARGINTVVGYESESDHTSMADWSQAATDKGLFMIRQPSTSAAADVRESMLLAWLHGDEPDVRKIDPAQLIATYKRWKQLAPNIPVMVNLSGGNVLFKKTPKFIYDDYLKAADWVGNDFYPVTGWNHPDWLPKVGEAVDVLRDWSGGKPQYAFIECSSQQLAWLPKNTRGPKPDEMRAQIWNAVVHGAKGIVYFPQQFNPFSFDATPSNLSLQMARQNRRLAAISDILAQPANPPGINVSVNPPMEVGWRKVADGKLYLIVLNLSPDLQHEQPVKIAGYNGKKAKVLNEDERTLPVFETGFVDSFDPYDAHVYALGGD